jgi:broad specificity phosphatase PhoE
LIRRLESIVVDLEQQVIPTLVVSHVSVLQMLIAYFRNSPVEEAMKIEVPLHTVLKFTPARGGGWHETCHELAPVSEKSNSFSAQRIVSIEGIEQIRKQYTVEGPPASPTPIWGDHMAKKTSSSSTRQAGKPPVVPF